MQAQYDLNLILNPSLSAEQLATEKTYIEGAVTNAGAELVNVDEAGNRRLAYSIEKEREGYYLFYTIKAGGNPEKDIAASLRLRDNVRRVLVVKDRPEWKTKKA
jgi:small subunit ribosomal protein S6